MVYVHRNDQGEITRLTARPKGSTEQLTYANPEIIEFIDESKTKGEIYDESFKINRLLKAVVMAINDGSFVPGSSLNGGALKALIISKM